MSGAEGGAELTAKGVLCGGYGRKQRLRLSGAAAVIYIVVRMKHYRISQVRTNV